jgi:CDP-glucose 4,6-dehydratase
VEFWQSSLEGLDMNPQFWRQKRVLITGHTGFKGSWLSLWLQSLSAEVIGFSLPAPTRPSLFELAEVASGMKSITGDVRDIEHLRRVLRESLPAIVVHMAAQALVRRSYLDPIGTYATNVMGTAHLLEAVRETETVRAVVVVTSDKCYENTEQFRPYRETDPMGGFDPYSSSKGCAELVTAAFRNSFFHRCEGGGNAAIASCRSGNVIGGGDWAEDRLMPDLMRSALEGRQATIRNPHAIRPWQHVLEPLSGYLLLAQKLYEEGARYSQGWNFGPNEEDAKPVSWIVERIAELWEGGLTWSVDTGSNPHEAHCLRLDCSEAKAKLGWQPQWDLAKSLEATVAWFRAYQSRECLRQLTLEQIHSYRNAMSLTAGSRE